MNSFDAEFWATMVVGLLFVVVLSAAAIWADATSCHSKWEGYGATRYSMWGGCQVRVGDKWVPVDTIREVL